MLAHIRTILTGNVLAQACNIVLAASLPYFFEDTEVGNFGTLISACMICSVLFTLKFELLVSGQNEKRRAETLSSASTFSWLVSIVLCFAWLISDIVFEIRFVSFGDFITCIGVCLTLGYYDLLRADNIGAEKYNHVARAAVVVSVVRIVLVVVSGILDLGWRSLLWSELFARTSGLFVLSGFQRLVPKHGPRELYSMLRDQWRFPFVVVPSTFLNMLAQHGFIFVCRVVVGEAGAGVAFFAHRLTIGPTSIIAMAVSDVYFRQYSRIDSIGIRERKALRKSIFRNLLKLGFLAIVPGYLFGGFAIDSVFGSNWADIGLAIVALIPWAFGLILVNPVSRPLVVSNAAHYKWIYDLGSLSFLVVWLGLGVRFELGVVSLLWGIAVTQGLMYIVYYRLIFEGERKQYGS